MRMGVPASSVNCLEGWGFFVFASRALGMGAMRVPRPAAGMITITFMAGCKYTSAEPGVQMCVRRMNISHTLDSHLSTYNIDILSFRETFPWTSPCDFFCGYFSQ